VKKTLAQYIPGQYAQIVSVAEHAMGAKLIEMGFYPGKRVQVLFRAPFRGPFAIDAGGAVLSLREDEASLIETIDC
jgi:Fe2+ transport system protein FeoA